MNLTQPATYGLVPRSSFLLALLDVRKEDPADLWVDTSGHALSVVNSSVVNS